jgi:Ca2+-binding EF-hand superfamily protein
MTHVESSFAAMAHLINKYCEVPGQDITTLFKSFDTDGSGAVSYQELRDGEWPRLAQYAESPRSTRQSLTDES